MATLNTPTGTTVIAIAGTQIEYVGRFTADDIDQDAIDNAGYSGLDIAYNWIYDMLVAASLNPASLTASQAAYANHACNWRAWEYYWTLSHQGETIPDDTQDKDSTLFYVRQNRAKKLISADLKALAIADTTGYLKTENGVNGHLDLISFSTGTKKVGTEYDHGYYKHTHL